MADVLGLAQLSQARKGSMEWTSAAAESALSVLVDQLLSERDTARTLRKYHRTKNTRRAIRVGEQPRFMPSSPGTGLPLKLFSATVTADGSRHLDLEPDHLLQLKLSVSARVLGGFDILLAATDKSRESAADSSENVPGTERLELHINSILLSSLPRLIHLSGRSLAAHHDEAAARSYTLTLIFSAGSDTAMFWSTTFDVPRSPLVDSTWHLTVPFSHSLKPADPPHAP